MLYRIFSIHDSKLGAFNQPFFAPNAAVALRSFSDACQDANSPYARHPSDFNLFDLGTFDDSVAGFTLHTAPKQIGSALEYVGSGQPA